jgi:hypothetical protein
MAMFNSFLYVYQRVMYVMLNPISSTINRHKKRRDSARSTWKIPIVHGWITIESYKNLENGSFHSPLSERDPWKMPKNASRALMIWTNYTSSSWIFHELMTPEVNGKSLFLVDKTASHSNYTPIPSHEILVGSWLSYGLSTRLLFSSIIWSFHVSCLKHLKNHINHFKKILASGKLTSLLKMAQSK